MGLTIYPPSFATICELLSRTICSMEFITEVIPISVSIFYNYFVLLFHIHKRKTTGQKWKILDFHHLILLAFHFHNLSIAGNNLEGLNGYFPLLLGVVNTI